MNGTRDGFKLPGFEIYQEKWEIRFENLNFKLHIIHLLLTTTFKNVLL